MIIFDKDLESLKRILINLEKSDTISNDDMLDFMDRKAKLEPYRGFQTANDTDEIYRLITEAKSLAISIIEQATAVHSEKQ